MTPSRFRRLLAATAAAASFCALAPASPASAAPNTAGEYVALTTPTRILDTRNGTGRPGTAPVPANGQIDVQVTGAFGVPASGVETVVMNVTAAAPTSEGYVSVWPTGGTRPDVSSLNFVAGQTVPNLVTVRVGDGGRVSLFNAFGTTHLIADVVGYYDDTSVSGGWYNPVSPSRVLDTRSAIGVSGTSPVGPRGQINVAIAGRGGVPAGSTAAAVVLNITAVEPSAGGYVTVWPGTGVTGVPNVSTLNFSPGQTIANLAIVRLGDNGTINLYNESGATHLLADVVGWFDRTGTSGLVFRSVAPIRAVNTRFDGIKVGADQGPHSSPIDGAGLQGLGIRVVVMNVTATDTTADSYFTIYRTDLVQPGSAPPAPALVPNVSSLNWKAGQTVPNLVMSEVSVTPNPLNVAAGLATVYNANGETHLIQDVVGYFIPRPA